MAPLVVAVIVSARYTTLKAPHLPVLEAPFPERASSPAASHDPTDAETPAESGGRPDTTVMMVGEDGEADTAGSSLAVLGQGARVRATGTTPGRLSLRSRARLDEQIRLLVSAV